VRGSVSSDGAQANGSSINPRISADGRYVAFVSEASNLAPETANDSQGTRIFVHDLQTGQTVLASKGLDGTPVYAYDLSLSGDGRFIAFASKAANFAAGLSGNMDHIFVRDRQTGETSLVSRNNSGSPGNDSYSRRRGKAIRG